MDILSLFCGCGGLDLGFHNSGFNVIWANDNNKTIEETYRANHHNTNFILGDISKIDSSSIPDAIGLIGGPPCQSWSAAGKGLGIDDSRGKLFFEFVRVLKDKKPLFFLAENVKGMLSKRHKDSLALIVKMLEEAGYELSIELVNAADYNVPQNRERVIIVGYRKDLNLKFEFPQKQSNKPSVRNAIGDLTSPPLSNNLNVSNGENTSIPNHEYFQGSYSYIFMSRNRVLDWEQQSYTIQASGRQASIHPQAPKMLKVAKDIMCFDENHVDLYRRLSIRECARIQTFPDNFHFYYNSLDSGYKMIGNAVPVNLANALAGKIFSDLQSIGANITQRLIAQEFANAI